MKENEDLGLYLNIRIYVTYPNETFNYKSNYIKEINTFIENRAYILRNYRNEFIKVEQQAYIDSEKKKK